MEVLFFLFIGLLYFLPTVICVMRDHPSKAAIIVLNILAGWTFIGWVVATVWSFTSPNSGPATPAPAAPTASPASSGPASGGTAEQLQKLVELKEKGVLDDEEFQREKAKLLR